MYETECDIILNLVYNLRYTHLESNGGIETSHLISESDKLGIQPKTIEIVVAILIRDKQVTVTEFANARIVSITQKGRAFIATTSYVSESHLLELQKQLNEKNIQKLEQDILLNKWLLKTKWLPLIISIIGLIVSILAYKESKKEHEKRFHDKNTCDTVKYKLQ